MKVELIRMKRRRLDETQIRKSVCIINPFCHGGEYTLCGDAWPDSTLKHEDIERIGEPFKGTYKDISCVNCRNILLYVKNIVFEKEVENEKR
jgi:hypothetical protein